MFLIIEGHLEIDVFQGWINITFGLFVLCFGLAFGDVVFVIKL